MSNDEDAKKRRAEQLRQQISGREKVTHDEDAGGAGMKPGESPHAYVERRMRELHEDTLPCDPKKESEEE